MKSTESFVDKTRFVELNDLKPHENVDAYRVARLKAQIERDGMLKLAIAVDIQTRVILDGHHRLEALRQIGCKRIPVTFFDYSSPLIEVTQRNGLPLSKSEIIEAGLSRRLYPSKTSKHMIRSSKIKKHISKVEERVNVPLRPLKRRSHSSTNLCPNPTALVILPLQKPQPTPNQHNHCPQHRAAR